MKKILTLSGPLTFSAQRSLHFLLPQTCALNRPKFAQFCTQKPANSLFEQGDLVVTEIQSSDNIKGKDSAARPLDQSLQLNATFEWRPSNTESVVDEAPPTAKMNRAQKRMILFKTNAKDVVEKYPAAEQLLAAAENIEFPKPVMCAMIMTNPKISLFDAERVRSNLLQLMQLGFQAAEVKSMIRRYPDLLTYKGSDIFDTFEVWRTASLSERFLCELFSMHPLLLSVSNDEAIARLKRINFLMMNKITRVKSLIEKNAAIFDGDWDRVEENFKYLYTTMRISERDISRSRGLSLPLAFIKLRHTFLERCGEYIRPKKKDVVGFNTRKNPPLHAILDTSDEVFAVNVAKVSYDEYLVFKALMKRDDVQPSECIFMDNDC